MASHEIEYRILGDDLQFVEVMLDPNETVISESGGMMFMSDGVEMETQFGGGDEGGMLNKMFTAGKRMLTGESLFLSTFTYRGKGKGRVAFAAPYPGKIIPLDLKNYGTMLCQKDSYLCSAKGIEVSLAFTKKIGVGLFGGEGFILQKLAGDGLTFVHAGGTVHEIELGSGETLRVDTGCIVAFQERVQYDIKYVGGVKTALFGGEGLFFAVLTGPGKVFLQSLPFSRLADRIYRSMPARGGSSVEEGSVIGGLGKMLMGDR